MSEEKLKPCPFCGGEAKENSYDWQGRWLFWVKCKKCGATIYSRIKVEVAEKAWNKRHKEQDDE